MKSRRSASVLRGPFWSWRLSTNRARRQELHGRGTCRVADRTAATTPSPYTRRDPARLPTVDPRPVFAHDTELLTPATQIVADKDAYLGNATNDIGRRVSDEQLELFVVCQPAEAMRQQFAALTPDFIAIHDVGCNASARLVAAVAAAAKRKVQKLVIRRQGYGVALATLQFVELKLPAGSELRIYTTQVDADTQSRHELAEVLLAHSRLGVVMVGDLPAHALQNQLQPLRDTIAAGSWPNRQMLLVPLANVPALPAQALELAGTSSVVVRTTPTVGRPAEAWSYISGAWNRLNATEGPARQAPPRPSAAPPPAAVSPPAQPLEFSPMPVPSTAAAAQAPTPQPTALWTDYVARCEPIKGLVQVCVFDVDRQRPIAYSGAARTAERLAAKGAMLCAVMSDAADAIGLGTAPPDAVITLAEHYLLLRPMPGQPRIVLHLVLDRNQANIGLVRAQLLQIDQALLTGSA